MSCLTFDAIRCMARGEKWRVDIDWGENTSGSETGALKAGDTVASATVAVHSKNPSTADDPTLSSVTVNGSAIYVNGRSCSAGEATTFTVTAASDQAYGEYVLKVTATTTATYVFVRFIKFVVQPPG